MELLIKNRSRFEALQNFTIDSGKEDNYSARSSTEARDDDLASLASDGDGEAATETSASQPATLSERARGKQPIHPQTSDTASNAAEILQQMPLTSVQPNPSFRPTPEWVSSLYARLEPQKQQRQELTFSPQLHAWQPYLELHNILRVVENRPANLEDTASPAATQHTQHEGEKTPPRRVGFRWTSQALGWYLSVLWGLVYAADSAMNRGSSGVWAGTSIKLFNVVSQREQVSLRSPKGAVDAAGDAIARRITSFSFGTSAAASPSMREV